MRIPVTDAWDPFWFIDYCQACAGGGEPGEQLARMVQKREWEFLFDYCLHNAIGAEWPWDPDKEF
jgi:hypothetical protein